MSLKKIAEMTGVSPSTVSRVLNHTSPSCASKELQDKIFEAARSIGYRPNENARMLRKQNVQNTNQKENVHHISIILARIRNLKDDPFFYELFRCLEEELFKSRVAVDQVIYADDEPVSNITKSQGIIILGRCSQKLLGHILAQTKNVIGIWRNSMDYKLDEVVCDGRKAAELAMEYLISLGHKNIAYIGDCSYESRYIGYCNSFINHHIPLNYEWIRQTDQTGEAGGAAFQDLLNKSDDFTAVFCANDVTAITVLHCIQTLGRKLKRKISVISIDDIEESQNTTPYLTTIHIPRAEMAHMAVTMLIDRMEKKHTEAVRIEFPCRMMKRDSCYKTERQVR